MAKGIHALYFSPTHTTQKIVEAVAEKLTQRLGLSLTTYDLTAPEARKGSVALTREDVMVLGLPVYAGRIPALLEETVKSLQGQGTPAVILAVYGNRDYDDALLEMRDLLQAGGFVVIAAGAFIGEHSFTGKVGENRPDAIDLKIAAEFGEQIAEKLVQGGVKGTVTVKGSFPYKERGPAWPFVPKTKEDCTNCMLCVDACPTGATSGEDPAEVNAAECIRCCACVKCCPVEAKYFDDKAILDIVAWLEGTCRERKEPELFV